MSDVPLHRLYLHYSELPYSQRILYTAALLVLGMGYLFAMINLFHTYAGRAGGNPLMLSYEDIVIAYSGSGKASRLESALRGPMSSMLPPEEISAIIAWVQEGADRAKYESDIKPTLDKRCMTCHDGSNPHLPNLNGYDNLKKVTEQDTGANVFTLVRVSHIHLFGVTFIFFIVGLIFSHAYVRPVWFKCAVVALPFAALFVDIALVVFHEALPSVRLGRDVRRRRHGPVLRLHVGGDHVSDVVLRDADAGRPARERRSSRPRLTARRLRAAWRIGHDAGSSRVTIESTAVDGALRRLVVPAVLALAWSSLPQRRRRRASSAAARKSSTASCVACHGSGANGAPKIGDNKAWAKRAAQGLTGLTASALKGIRQMPPHGGNPNLTDTEIERAITYMVNQSGGHWTEPISRTTKAPERSGEQIVQARCVKCHETGEGGAPKIGDQAAWMPRVKQGLDVVVRSAIKGHGGMPARGGQADLTDPEMRSAVVYMFNKSTAK